MTIIPRPYCGFLHKIIPLSIAVLHLLQTQDNKNSTAEENVLYVQLTLHRTGKYWQVALNYVTLVFLTDLKNCQPNQKLLISSYSEIK